MRVLVACEFSGRVREAFRKRGHDAWSCDILPSEIKGNHYQCDVREVLYQGWDLLIAFPPCTYLAISGMHWTTRGFRDPQLTEDALDFVKLLMDAPIERICVENPVSVISTRIRKPDQIIEPRNFGHPESKRTCLWLKNLPKLRNTYPLKKPEDGIWKNQTKSKQNKLAPSEERWKDRSRTYKGIAAAMAGQWGALCQ